MIPKIFFRGECILLFQQVEKQDINEEYLDKLHSMKRIYITIESQGYRMSIAVLEAYVLDSKGSPKLIERLT